MYQLSVNRYKILKPCHLFDQLFLAGDLIWIQDYDPEGGRAQSVFKSDRELLGTITSDRYWQLKKGYIEKYEEPVILPLRMNVAYIAHPIGGNVRWNLEKVQKIVRGINMDEPNVVPFAPYYLDCIALDDSVPAERERGMKNNAELMRSGFIDEVRLYGDRISSGMEEEIKLAHELKIPVVPMTPETESEYLTVGILNGK